MNKIVALILCMGAFGVCAQRISGVVKGVDGTLLGGVMMFLEGSSTKTTTDEQGRFSFDNIPVGSYKVVAFFAGYVTTFQEVQLEGNVELSFAMKEYFQKLESIVIQDAQIERMEMDWLQSVTGSAIYEAKKTEVIVVENLIGNKAANVGRQVYSRISGLNIWESDGAGLNLSIGGRGLNPNRTSNFNVRQNGYDISADALGYPESYYTPPVQALTTIEVVRGAAGLQYGTQFGGMLNFDFKEGPENKKIELLSNNTAGSYGLFNTFNSVGGTVGKVNYYGFYQYKTIDGMRPNSHTDQHVAFGAVTYNFTPFLSAHFEHTYMTYLSQQPGGLTDAQFSQDPKQSTRTRNWFQVGWNLSAMEWNFRVNSKLKFNNRTFLLSANRYAVGNLERIDRPDDLTKNRNLLKDNYINWGNEFRTIYHYNLFGKSSVLLVGNRLYFGKTHRKQGEGNSALNANFDFSTEEPNDSNFTFPSNNVAFFAENIVNITPHFSITPGARYEYIDTQSDGYYYDRVEDLAGNVISEEKVQESRSRGRDFVFFGVGVSYKSGETLEVYGNFSQNFRGINFNDIRVDNPSLVVDENIHDERGFNLDLGVRGAKSQLFKYDVSLFMLSYKGRIGNVLRTEPDPKLNNLVDRTFRYRTNVADAIIYGVESYAEVDAFRVLKLPKIHSLTTFVNLALIDSEYISDGQSAVKGKKVELVPAVNLKTGLTYHYQELGVAFQYTYMAEQYSDASNAPSSVTAVEGLIPTYFILDLSADYEYQIFKVEAGVNNVTNEYYFTRRASGYPGPGILPANGRNFYVGITVKI